MNIPTEAAQDIPETAELHAAIDNTHRSAPGLYHTCGYAVDPYIQWVEAMCPDDDQRERQLYYLADRVVEALAKHRCYSSLMKVIQSAANVTVE